VNERDIQLTLASLGDSAITADDNYLFASIQKLLGLRGELVPPVAVERIEDVATYLIGANVGTAVRKTLGLLPFDRRIQVSEHAVEVVSRERFVRVPRDLYGRPLV
jgi:hypothetical protein